MKRSGLQCRYCFTLQSAAESRPKPPTLTFLTERCYAAGMETIMFKAINPNVSALLREQTEKLLSGQNGTRSAYDKARHLMFHSGRRDAATSKDYLKQYAPKNHR
jgi:hypothetical protein